ncbi:alpha/beta hydrolase [Arthrobacter sp. H14-L1]|uniref:alpha/beta hydrolase n=1 Tax=Arthrobacter sp. H14-L1 TaxID=2996697 RepID=UPI00226E1695|nr:phospholipase [Arthrobacter sp. H14-L1]MCY0904621.1 phospholipase [Arthrobacter sp. H14-L1]
MTDATNDPGSAPIVTWSKAEPDRQGTPLLLMLHGYGADEADLFSLAPTLPEEFTVASLRGPERAGPGYCWFPLRADVSYAVENVTSATEAVTAWLDTVRGQHSSVTLLGFSQGMCMATSLARHRPHDFAAVVGLSGFVVDAGTQGEGFFHDAELAAARLPVFWGRDQADPVIPAEAVDYTATWLRTHSKLTKILYTGIWHGINAQEMAHVKEFLSLTVLQR